MEQNVYDAVKKAHTKIFKAQEKLFQKKEAERLELEEGEKRHGKVEIPGVTDGDKIDFDVLN